MQAYIKSTQHTMTREMGITGKLVVGGAVSTGLLLGGFTVASMALAGRMSGGGLLTTSVGLFFVGSLLGLALSAAFGILGREATLTWRQAARDAAKGTLYAIPACFMGAVLAGWMGMAVIGLYVGSVLPIIGSALAAMVALGVMAATLKVTLGAGANALHRLVR
ncbi:MAG: hypothetical protein WEB88_08440 [Gemmatimonadota bacterium]